MEPAALESRGNQPGRFLDRLWIAASSAQLTIGLAAILAFTVAVAALLPQLPAGAEPLAADRWLLTTAARYGRFGPLLSSSGLFNVLAGPWITTLLAVTGVHLLLRVANQARRLAGSPARIPPAPQGLPFELVHLPVPVDAIQGKVAALISGHKSPGVVVADVSAVRPRLDAYVERHYWASAGPLLSYLGPLLVVLGLLWNTVGGWRVIDVTLIPGRTVQPAQAGGLALSLVDAGAAENGRPGVISLAQGSQARYAWLGYARPAIWGSAWVAQQSSGPALAVRASESGNPLPVQSLEADAAAVDSLHLRFGQNESEQAFTIPAAGLAFRVVSYERLAERGIDRPVFLIEGYQGADPTPALNELVEDSGTIEWQGVSLTLQREAYVVVDLAAMPGLPLLTLGGLLLLAGAAITAWGGFTRTWLNAAAEHDGTLTAVRVASPALGQAEVARVAARLAAPAEAGPPGSRRSRSWLVYAAWTLAGALLFAGLGALSLRGVGPFAGRQQAWVLILHLVLVVLGLGAIVVAAGQSLWFMVRGSKLSDIADPMLRGPVQGLRGRAGDPGRAVSLAAFPLLTCGVLLASLWGLLVFAAPIRPVASEMWLLAAWLLAAAYFHVTSGWRPLRLPTWLGPVLVTAALAAGIAACLAASSLLTL